MTEIEKFQNEVKENIEQQGADQNLLQQRRQWILDTSPYKYSYNFTALGRPIIQYPEDIVAMQEIIWDTRPDLIIETGIAHGGSLIHYASILALLDYTDAIQNEEILDPAKPKRRILGMDIDIRSHNRKAIESHPLSNRIDMFEGSSIATDMVSKVRSYAEDYKNIMVVMDSNHTHDHVLEELKAYAPLTSKDCYCVVFDTVVEDMPDFVHANRPWGPGNNPKTAVWEYLEFLKDGGGQEQKGQSLEFEIDKTIENKLLITVAPDGFLKRTS